MRELFKVIVDPNPAINTLFIDSGRRLDRAINDVCRRHKAPRIGMENTVTGVLFPFNESLYLNWGRRILGKQNLRVKVLPLEPLSFRWRRRHYRLTLAPALPLRPGRVCVQCATFTWQWYTTFNDHQPFCEACSVENHKRTLGYLIDNLNMQVRTSCRLPGWVFKS